MRFFFRVILVCLTLAAPQVLGNHAWAEEKKCTLRAERKSAFTAALCTTSIFVNGHKVGVLPNGEKGEFPFQATKDGKNVMYMEFNLAGGKSKEVEFSCFPGGIVTAIAEVENEWWSSARPKFSLRVENTGKQPAPQPGPSLVAKAEVLEEIVDKVVFTEPYETIEGVMRTFTVERSFERSIMGRVTGGVEAGVRGTVGLEGFASLSGEIKTRVETSLGITIGEKKSITESFTLDGTKVKKVNVVWVERYRQGIATLSDGKTVPFSVRVGLRLKIEKVK